MTKRFFCLLFVLSALTQSLALGADDQQAYPEYLTFTEAGVTHQLTLTGQAERIFLFFNVYAIAHYAQNADYGQNVEAQPLSFEQVVEDGPAKAIVITFARKLGREKIRNELDKSLRRNAKPEWLAAAEPSIAIFMNAIDRDALKGDKLVFYWLEGGRLFAEFNGERAFSVTDAAFAKLIWLIWFGNEPAVDRDALLSRSTSPGDP